MTLHYWYDLITLPFKFFAVESYHWTKEQITMLINLHKSAMLVIVITSGGLMVAGTLAQSTHAQLDNTIRNQASVMTKVEQLEKYSDKIEQQIERNILRLAALQDQINVINIQNSRMTASVETLTSNLVWGLRILGGMGLVLLGQFTTYVFGLKLARAKA
jgi:hypothetical protein